VIVDPKGRDFTRYRNATLIKPNAKELAEASQLPVANTDQQISAARKLLADTNAQYILLTRGADGMLLIPHDGEAHAFKSLAREVFEVSGAGDTVASALAAALGSGCSIDDSAAIANIAAGIVVGKVGTATVDRSEIVHEIEHKSALIASDKILRPDQAVERIRMWKRSRLKVGFIFGVFSNLAPADLESLEKARNACDRLVIGVRKDPSASQDQPTRAYVLASMVFSDAIVVCDDPTADALLSALQPDLVF
jgi:D-beta-D-heptose 7-phosphate kinase/D-beta-D-heptose 1-phosphate adenosyltransferase